MLDVQRGAAGPPGALVPRAATVRCGHSLGAPAHRRLVMAWLFCSLPVCPGAGEMMSLRRTQNPVRRGPLSRVLLQPRVSEQGAFCSRGWKFFLSGLKNVKEVGFEPRVFQIIEG